MIFRYIFLCVFLGASCSAKWHRSKAEKCEQGELVSGSERNFYVAAPNTIRLGAEETVAVACDCPGAETVRLYIQNHPGRGRNITNVMITVEPGSPQIVEITVKYEDFPDADFSNPLQKHFVYLGVQSGSFNKEAIIPITAKSGYFFIHTDKPIYTPKQTVKMRLMPLNEKTLPTKQEFKLQILNPQNIIQFQKHFNRGQSVVDAFVTDTYKLPKQALIGEWAIRALYGPKFQLNSSVTFEVKKYVLPTFTLKLQVPEVILPDDEHIYGTVEAKYVYGRNVKGTAFFKLGVKGNDRFFTVKRRKELVDGIASFRVSISDFRTKGEFSWFPLINGKNLIVEAMVTDFASGKQEKIRNENGRFSESPYVISFQRCLKDFKPGLVSVIEADIKYLNGNPAADVRAVVSAVADNNIEISIPTEVATSDEEGRVSFLIHPETHHATLTATVRTEDPRYGNNQAVATHTQKKFMSESKGYIAIARRSSRTLMRNENFQESVYIEPAEIRDVYYIIISKGRILEMKKLLVGCYKQRSVEFPVTAEMAPSFRLVVFTQYKGKLIADSLKLKVDDHCSPNAEVTLEPTIPSPRPGDEEKIIIRGSSGTLVGLLAVDQAVYSLRDKDRLTKSKMFRTLDSHDLGCGPGGGRSTDLVLGNAGVVVMTNKFSPPLNVQTNSCEERIRRKRDIYTDIVGNFTGQDLECCKLGMLKNIYGISCEERSEEIEIEKYDDEGNCSLAFLTCCLAVIDPLRAGAGDADDDIIVIGDDFVKEIESQTAVRQDFKETWLFQKLWIGPGSNREEFSSTLPSSITTWVVQAVSVSEEYGMCVADPVKVVVFQDFFLQVNFPYSVVRQEQIEVQAIVFNYSGKKTAVSVYIYGVKGICSEATEKRRSEPKVLHIHAHSSASVSFPIVPVQEGDFNIQVGAYSTKTGSDIIIKKLHVVPEGYPMEKHVSVVLDPMNKQNRTENVVITDDYKDEINPTKRLQVTSIKLKLPEDFVPGSESYIVSIIADEFGPPVETAVQNPDSLTAEAKGCGEQTMIFLAPTIYTMRYLRESGKMSQVQRERGLQLIQQGYQQELTYRKEDGSYAAFVHRPASTWLTAFVMKVFCQASSFFDIEPKVMRSGVNWLIEHQNEDGSFTENHAVYHRDMLSGVEGRLPMTAFVLIALQECTCDVMRLEITKAHALSYLENNLEQVKAPLPVALVAYAMALSDSRLKDVAYNKLKAIGVYDESRNTLYWGTGHATQDVQITSYALLTSLLFKDAANSRAIVNWLNTKRLSTGAYASTQDTVMALQALSQYAIYAKEYDAETSLVCNISVSSDKNFHQRFAFNGENAMVARYAEIPSTDGELFVKSEGYGVGLITVSLKYNVPVFPEKECKFNVTVNVTEVENTAQIFASLKRKSKINRKNLEGGSREEFLRGSSENEIESNLRKKREDDHEEKEYKLKMDICVRYLGQQPSDMTIVDAGIFSGFEAIREDLEELVKSEDHFIDLYEITSRSVLFYLEKVPTIEPYCFTFNVRRKYIVGKVEKSVVNVYDYYSPEESCTKFYAPGKESPMLKKTCQGRVCQCVEGGCPPEEPFKEVTELESLYSVENDINEAMRNQLALIACENYNYAWKGKVIKKTRDEEYLHIDFEIIIVIKAGTEKATTLKDQRRILMARRKCKTADLQINETYYIMGKDGETPLDESGSTGRRYILGENTALAREWTIKDGAERSRLGKVLSYMEKDLPKKGCKS